jgi:hypothetical protein
MGIYMAAKETQDIALSYKELKKKAKQQKKAGKKDKKKAKREKKYAKKEAKMRKKGVFLDDLTTTEEEVEVVTTAEEFEERPWVRKSTDDIPLLEKKIDMMTDRADKSGLHSLFEERFGESLIVPETYQEYELSESEKRRLEAIRAVEVEPEPVVVEETPAEAAPVEAKKGLFGRSKKAPAEVVAPAEAEVIEEPGLKPIYYPFQPWIYKKFSPGKHKVVQILLLVISIILLVLALIPRLIIWIIITIFKTLGSKRKAKKEKKAEAEATPEA